MPVAPASSFVTTQSVSTLCQMSPGNKLIPVENHCFKILGFSEKALTDHDGLDHHCRLPLTSLLPIPAPLVYSYHLAVGLLWSRRPALSSCKFLAVSFRAGDYFLHFHRRQVCILSTSDSLFHDPSYPRDSLYFMCVMGQSCSLHL